MNDPEYWVNNFGSKNVVIGKFDEKVLPISIVTKSNDIFVNK